MTIERKDGENHEQAIVRQAAECYGLPADYPDELNELSARTLPKYFTEMFKMWRDMSEALNYPTRIFMPGEYMHDTEYKVRVLGDFKAETHKVQVRCMCKAVRLPKDWEALSI